MLTRRQFLTVAAAALGTGLAGCSNNRAGETDQPAGSAENAGSAVAGAAGSAADEGATAPAGGVLVAYFSATGNTAGVAAELADHLGADVFAITPAEPYTADDLDYNDSGSRTSIERAEDARPELAQVAPDAFEAYGTVFVGYPIWWGDAAWPVKTFVEGNDFSGKTVVPFCTSASSGIGGSGDELAGLAGTGTWIDGERFVAGASADEVASWADGLAL
ncbi:flavodoxin [[Collinsella] massiliensis]|uniref:Flavodoxin-like domain-containing protein n=1 Tax=[Collinsella] massiliensis TaxID=1232426 RepID=A0A1Y3Y2T4_9ACTN|nr:flavodoxin [[Collinsella] massiliensis]OUN88640.1 hypothetical protein B5G02_05340 [[Collinsella] massiliensis]